jgi:hypothetical protein
VTAHVTSIEHLAIPEDADVLKKMVSETVLELHLTEYNPPPKATLVKILVVVPPTGVIDPDLNNDNACSFPASAIDNTTVLILFAPVFF